MCVCTDFFFFVPHPVLIFCFSNSAFYIWNLGVFHGVLPQEGWGNSQVTNYLNQYVPERVRADDHGSSSQTFKNNLMETNWRRLNDEVFFFFCISGWSKNLRKRRPHPDSRMRSSSSPGCQETGNLNYTAGISENTHTHRFKSHSAAPCRLIKEQPRLGGNTDVGA